MWLACGAGCVGGLIQYYGEARHQQHPAATGVTVPMTFTSRYCGVEAYWQLKPGQLRNLISSVSESLAFDWDSEVRTDGLVHCCSVVLSGVVLVHL